MQYKTPHVVILAGVADFVDNSHLGTDLLISVLPDGSSTILSVLAYEVAHFALWLFAMRSVLPLLLLIRNTADALIRFLEFLGRSLDIAYHWGRHQLVRSLKSVLTRLEDHDSSELR